MGLDYPELVKRIRQRDAKALEEVYLALGTRVCSIVRRYAGEQASHEDIEEGTQDVFVIVWKDIEKYDPTRSSFVTWIAMLAKYRAFAIKRANAQRFHREQVGVPEDAQAAGASALIDSLVDKLEAESDRLTLRAIVKQLSEEEVRLLSLRYDRGLSYRSIAEEVHQDEAVLRKRMSRLVLKLRALFREKKSKG